MSVVDPCTHQVMGIEPPRLPAGGRVSAGGRPDPAGNRLVAAGLGRQSDLDLGLSVAHTDAGPTKHEYFVLKQI